MHVAVVGGGPEPLTFMPQDVDPAGESWPLYDALTAVTVCPDCVAVAFHAVAMSSEPGRLSAAVQLGVCTVPLFCTVIDSS